MRNKIEVDITPFENHVSVTLVSGLIELSGYYWRANKPNFIERLFGITFESNVLKAVEKAKRKADELNSNYQRTKEIACKIQCHQAKRDINVSNPPRVGTGLPSKEPGNKFIRENGKLVNIDDPNFTISCPEPIEIVNNSSMQDGYQ